jgi:hypothetical protein
LLNLQITDLADSTHRRKLYTPEEFAVSLEHSVDASERVWDYASEYQRQQGRPVFLIANERTGPSDVAAEFLDESVIAERGVNNHFDMEGLLNNFLSNERAISSLYEQFLKGENVTAQLTELIGSDIIESLQLETSKILPVYRVKIPSSISTVDENTKPQVMNEVHNLFKLITMLGGSVVVMDESTRPAPRSLELLYANLQRWGGANVDLSEKITNIEAQLHTQMTPIQTGGPMNVALIDPWPLNAEKPFPDDTVGVTPDIDESNSKAGVVTFRTPSWFAITPEGFTTIQKMWMMMVARAVSKRL